MNAVIYYRVSKKEGTVNLRSNKIRTPLDYVANENSALIHVTATPSHLSSPDTFRNSLITGRPARYSIWNLSQYLDLS